MILSMSKDQETYKRQLNRLLEQLNDALDKSSNKLYQKEKKNPNNLKNLEHLILVRQKELANSRNQVKLYKQQYELVNSKANEKCSNDK